MVLFWDDQLAGFMSDSMGAEYDLLLGHRTYVMMAAFWPPSTATLAAQLNPENKYVRRSRARRWIGRGHIGWRVMRPKR
jgi:hypothetical protein